MTGSERRAIAVGLIAIIVLLSAAKGLPRYLEWERQQLTLAAEGAREARLLRQHSKDPRAVHDSVAKLRAVLTTLEKLAIRAGSLTEGELALVRSIEDAADSEGVEIASIAPVPVYSRSTSGAMQGVVRARVAVDGDLEAIVYFLAALESREPRVIIRQLSLSQPEIAVPGARLRADVVLQSLVVSALTPGTS